MAEATKFESVTITNTTTSPAHSSNGIIYASESASKAAKAKSRMRDKDAAVSASVKRRCVSTACIACRRRKSKVRARRWLQLPKTWSLLVQLPVSS